MTNLIATLEKSARITKALGEARLSNGQSLSEILTINEIPFWEIFSVEVARIYLPNSILSESKIFNFYCRIKPYLIRIKYITFKSRSLLLKSFLHKCNKDLRFILCLGFTEYIYRDTLESVVDYLVKTSKINIVSMHENIKYALNKNNSLVKDPRISELSLNKLELQIKIMHQDFSNIRKYLYTSGELIRIIKECSPEISNSVMNVFYRLLHADIPLFFKFATTTKSFLEKNRPLLTISPDVADPKNRAFILLCKKMGMPSLEIQFGPTGNEGIEWQFFSADKVAVWGDTSKHALTSHGIPAEAIAITGSPRHDKLVQTSHSEVTLIRSKYGIAANKRLVLLASAYQLSTYNQYSDPELLKRMKLSIFHCADQSHNLTLLVKPHPRENVTETLALAKHKKNINFIYKDADIRELIKICDAFISFGSTSTADALIAGKFVITPIFPGWIWSDLFKNSKATFTPNSTQNIMELFNIISINDHDKFKLNLEIQRQEFLGNWIYRPDGLATKRVADLAIVMANINQSS